MQCAAKSKRTGDRCNGKAVAGSDKCRMHGGKGSGRPPVHGRYSKAFARHPELLAAYETMRDDPALEETKNEIALLRALLAQYVEKFGSSLLRPDALSVVQGLAGDITKAVERRHKIEHGEKVTITVKDYEAFLARTVALTEEFFGAHPRYEAFLLALKAPTDE
jgi:hypothetical protein